MPKPKPKPTKPSTQSTSGTTTSSPPNWPPFKPSLPITDLLPVPHSSTDKIVLLPTFFPRALCRDYVAFLRTLPLVTTPGRPKKGEAVRVNDRFQIEDGEFARRLWEDTGLREALEGEDVKGLWGGKPIGLNPNIRIYRYSKGQYFDCHYDDYNLVTLHHPSTSAKTTWTLLLYLTSATEGCQGGETVFYPNDRQRPSEEIAVGLETGMLLLHKHGDDCLLHEGREVTAGEKWVLRTDLCIPR